MEKIDYVEDDYAAWRHKDGFDVYDYNCNTLIRLSDHEHIVKKLQDEIKAIRQAYSGR